VKDILTNIVQDQTDIPGTTYSKSDEKE